MVDAIISPWDVAPLRPILEEAGGRFSDWNGVPTMYGRDAVATNGRLHDEVLGILKG